MDQIKCDMRSKTESEETEVKIEDRGSDSEIVVREAEVLPPAFGGKAHQSTHDLQRLMQQAVKGWLSKTPSPATRDGYSRDLGQFLDYRCIDRSRLDELTRVLPSHVAAWRDHLRSDDRKICFVKTLMP